MKEWFEDTNFREKTVKVINTVNSILDEYREQGFVLTVRQLYYQLVARGIVANLQREYSRLVRTVGKGRLAGLIDWYAIEDRARSTRWASHWTDPSEIVQAAADSFRIDKWEGQPNHVEVMCEKDALSGVLGPVCRDLDVRFTANRGYSSLSHFYRIGQRIRGAIEEEDKQVHILYFGDHDPSGLDMDRDILDRLQMFSQSYIEVIRLALTMEQVTELNPPPNPAKVTDSRYDAYMHLYGDESWELDAVEPAEIRRLVEAEIIRLRDPDLWGDAVDAEEAMKLELMTFVDDYDDQ